MFKTSMPIATLTPRQKVIGVMYLVLTAMLALQVSSSVLDKFIDVKILAKVVSIHKETLDVLDYIDNLKDRLINLSGGIDPTTKLPKGLKNSGTVSRLMCNQEEGTMLKNKLSVVAKI